MQTNLGIQKKWTLKEHSLHGSPFNLLAIRSLALGASGYQTIFFSSVQTRTPLLLDKCSLKLELFNIYTAGLCVDGNVAVTCGTDGCVQKAVISQAGDTSKW